MTDQSDLAGAGISAKERLERIEHLLERMDGKLDQKADSTLVASMEARLRQIELFGTVQTQTAQKDIEGIRAAAEDLQGKLAKYSGALAVIVFGANALVYWLIRAHP